MSASDSDAGRPSEATISSTLRDTVIAIHKTGKAEELTLKRVRARVEQELGLDAGFFKQNAHWKEKSDAIITDAVDKYCGDEPLPSSATAVSKPKPKPKSAAKKDKRSDGSAQGVKRKAAAPAKKPKKRRKASSDEESEAELSDAESEPPRKAVHRAKHTVPEDSDDEDQPPKAPSRARQTVQDDESDAEPAPPVPGPDKTSVEAKEDGSDSDMSDLIDEPPMKKSRQKKDSSAKAKKAKTPAKPKAAPAKAKTSDSPDDAEIKRLQGWLVKCGIRKVWSRDPELSKCDTAKEKIQLLKNMLKDVGMDDKYSNEKAASIKEQREFAKDLAAIKEGNLAWGTAGEVNNTGRPSRRAAAKPIPQPKAVLSDDSDEEMGVANADSGDDDDESMHDVSDDDDNEKDGDSGSDDNDDDDLD